MVFEVVVVEVLGSGEVERVANGTGDCLVLLSTGDTTPPLVPLSLLLPCVPI